MNQSRAFLRALQVAGWGAAFAALVLATNVGFLQRVGLLVGQQRWVTLVGYVGVWGLCVLALLVAMLQANRVVRLGWALLFAASAAAGSGFRYVSGADLGVFDMVSLWAARHEAGRAAAFYSQDLYWPVAIVLATMLVAFWAPVPANVSARKWLGRLALVPAIPLVAIAAIVFVKEGGGAQALPVQFAPVSVGAVVGAKLAANPVPERGAVTMRPGHGMVRNIVVLVDESVRADFVDFAPGNPLTPHLAENRGRIADFGPASSGGNCSHYSNAILRFAAKREDLGGGILRDPTIWDYARKAGYETVFVDAQSAFNKNPGKRQNFMSAGEAAKIDRFYTMDETVPAPELDRRLLKIMADELSSGGPKLIYANKNGAHFPYDETYPPSERRFGPTIAETGENTEETRTGSYRNAIRWNVDLFFERLFAEADLSDTVILYTSDHGQVFDPTVLSHCTVEDPNPNEGLVPLFVTAGDPALEKRFEAAARESGPRTHFSIMPTVLELLGYPPEEVAAERGPTLLDAASERTDFSSGDIFGLFSSKVRWTSVPIERKPAEEGGALPPTAGRPAALKTAAKR